MSYLLFLRATKLLFLFLYLKFALLLREGVLHADVPRMEKEILQKPYRSILPLNLVIGMFSVKRTETCVFLIEKKHCSSRRTIPVLFNQNFCLIRFIA